MSSLDLGVYIFLNWFMTQGISMLPSDYVFSYNLYTTKIIKMKGTLLVYNHKYY